MTIEAVPPPVYWSLTERLTWPRGQDEFDPFWMMVLPLMTRNAHRPKARPGEVLARAGAKPSRIERWLRRDRKSAWREAGRVLSITKGAPLDWARLGLLLYRWDQGNEQMDFARDYFRSQRRAARTHTNDEGNA